VIPKGGKGEYGERKKRIGGVGEKVFQRELICIGWASVGGKKRRMVRNSR